MHSTIQVSLSVCLLAAAVHAQRVIVYDSPPVGSAAERTVVSPLQPSVGMATTLFPVMALPLTGTGDATYDGVSGVFWYTNGLTIATSPVSEYMPAGPLLGPYAVGPLIGMLGGPISGMARDPLANLLWLTGGMFVMAVTPGPGGLTVAVPPFLPGMGMVPPLTGLEWDPLTGRLLGVDAMGIVFPFFPGGAMAGAPIVPAVPIAAPVVDVAIDKTGNLNGIGARPLYVLSAIAVHDITTGEIFAQRGWLMTAAGLAFHPAPGRWPLGACACPSTTLVPAFGVSGPSVSGNAAFAVTLGNLPAGAPALFAFDFVFNPTFPTINAVGCPLGMVLGSPTLIGLFALAGTGGAATIPLPLLVPPGGYLFAQAATPCALDPTGLVLTPLLQIAPSAP